MCCHAVRLPRDTRGSPPPIAAPSSRSCATRRRICPNTSSRSTADTSKQSEASMRTLVISVLAATALVTYRSAIVAAPQQTTVYPGQMTEARVWIQNRPDRGEAIPVRLESASRELSPLRVHVVNAQNAPVFDEPIRARLLPRTWEYQSVAVPANQDVARRLNELGPAAWETTGVAFVAADGVKTILLKRPRP